MGRLEERWRRVMGIVEAAYSKLNPSSGIPGIGPGAKSVRILPSGYGEAHSVSPFMQ